MLGTRGKIAKGVQKLPGLGVKGTQKLCGFGLKWPARFLFWLAAAIPATLLVIPGTWLIGLKNRTSSKTWILQILVRVPWFIGWVFLGLAVFAFVPSILILPVIIIFWLFWNGHDWEIQTIQGTKIQVKRFILCDLHLGPEEPERNVIINKALDLMQEKVNQNEPGSVEILGLGDWFNIAEEGIDVCAANSLTRRLRNLSSQTRVRLITGNHDYELKDGEFGGIRIIRPFEEDSIWYCHGHERYCPIWFLYPWKLQKWVARRQFFPEFSVLTPSALKPKIENVNQPKVGKDNNFINKWGKSFYTLITNIVHAKATFSTSSNEESIEGIVLGHTHLPLQWDCPEEPFLINGGDMKDSFTFIEQDGNTFRLMAYDEGAGVYLTKSIKIVS